MIALAPLVGPRLQIGIGQASETRDIPQALAIKTDGGRRLDGLGVIAAQLVVFRAYIYRCDSC
jgi:hypothetical protein